LTSELREIILSKCGGCPKGGKHTPFVDPCTGIFCNRCGWLWDGEQFMKFWKENPNFKKGQELETISHINKLFDDS